MDFLFKSFHLEAVYADAGRALQLLKQASGKTGAFGAVWGLPRPLRKEPSLSTLPIEVANPAVKILNRSELAEVCISEVLALSVKRLVLKRCLLALYSQASKNRRTRAGFEETGG